MEEFLDPVGDREIHRAWIGAGTIVEVHTNPGGETRDGIGRDNLNLAEGVRAKAVFEFSLAQNQWRLYDGPVPLKLFIILADDPQDRSLRRL